MKARLLSRKKALKGYCFDVCLDRVVWPNGERLARSLVRHPGISVIVPCLDKGRIVLIRQYRYGVDRVLWEVPAGTIGRGESALGCAKREIQEEIGYRAARWRKLASSYTSPGYSTEAIHCFAATDLKKVPSALEHDEVLTAHVFTHAQVKRLMRMNQMKDAKSLIALFYFFKGLK